MIRKQLASILSIYIIAVFGYTSVAVYDWYWGVPNGLTGGRTKVFLPESGSLNVSGGVVRSVEDRHIVIRATTPNVLLQFENQGDTNSVFTLDLFNVKPKALAVDGVNDTDSAWKQSGPSALRFDITLPPQSRPEFRVSQRPENPGQVRFFVFGHIRNGELFFEELRSISSQESPDFMVCLGDSYYRAYTHKILELDRKFSGIPVPVFVIRGEIEYREPEDDETKAPHPLDGLDRLDRHPAIFGAANNWFDFGGARFIIMENGRDRNLRSFDWLESIAPASTPTVFFSHIPPYDPRTKISKDVTKGNPEEHKLISAELKRLGVDAAFFGHYRWHDERSMDEMRLFNTSVSVPSKPTAQFPHFLDVTLEEGRITALRRTLLPSALREMEKRGENSPPDTDSEGAPES